VDPVRGPEHEIEDGIMERWNVGIMEDKRKEDRGWKMEDAGRKIEDKKAQD
jgi:hypothetical protein